MEQKRCHLDGFESGGIEVQSTTMKVIHCLESFFVSEPGGAFIDIWTLPPELPVFGRYLGLPHTDSRRFERDIFEKPRFLTTSSSGTMAKGPGNGAFFSRERICSCSFIQFGEIYPSGLRKLCKEEVVGKNLLFCGVKVDLFSQFLN